MEKQLEDTFIEKHLNRIKNLQNHGIKVSTEWDCINSFQWMLDNSKFIFSWQHKRERISIVTTEPIEGYDCFEIDTDRYGIKVTGCTVFSKGWGDKITDSSKDIVPFIKAFLERSGATDLYFNINS